MYTIKFNRKPHNFTQTFNDRLGSFQNISRLKVIIIGLFCNLNFCSMEKHNFMPSSLECIVKRKMLQRHIFSFRYQIRLVYIMAMIKVDTHANEK